MSDYVEAEKNALIAEADRRLEAAWHEDQCACTPGLAGCLSGLSNRAPMSWTTDAVLDAVWDLISSPGDGRPGGAA